MPFFYPTPPPPAPYSILVINNDQSHLEDERENSDDDDGSVSADEQARFRLRMDVAGFQPEDFNVAIRHGRLIVHGKRTVHPPPIPDSNNDGVESDFVSREFQRTFPLPAHADIRKAHAQFFPDQQVLVIEIPFRNLTLSSAARPVRVRPVDIFLTVVTILLLDRALRITYRQYLVGERASSHSSTRD